MNRACSVRKSCIGSGKRAAFAGLACMAMFAAAGADALAQQPLAVGQVPEVARYLDGVRIAEPVVAGRLAVFPVLADRASLIQGQWSTLDAARSSGALLLRESRQKGKPALVWVEDIDPDVHVFLMKNQTLTWAAQTWKVRSDAVLAPGDKIRLDDLAAQVASVDGRKALPKETPSAKLRESYRPSSGEAEMRADATRYGMVSRDRVDTRAARTAEASGEGLEQLADAVLPRVPRGTTGFIFVEDGQPVAADFFGSEDLALKSLPKLLESHLARSTAAPPTPGGREPAATARKAIAFFEQICATGSETVLASAPGNVGLRTHEDGLLGEGVAYDGRVVHYEVRADILGTPYGRPSPVIIWPPSQVHRQ